jgi:phosphoribosyl 1,2-cyclic phosphodiesterase
LESQKKSLTKKLFANNQKTLNTSQRPQYFMSDNTTFRLKFWGTRGSIACPGPDTVKYGGNTTCFEVTCGFRRIIIDAGTGIRALGQKIMLEEGNVLDTDIFFTHTHMDHIQGCLSSLPSTTQRIRSDFMWVIYNPHVTYKVS